MANANDVPTRDITDPLIGRVLGGRYQVVRKLGEGGLGSVYVARQVAVGRDVAVKVLHEDIAAKEVHRQRFEREAKALAQLRHPNIIGIVDFGVDDGTSFLVMELSEGAPLGQVIDAGPLAIPVALDLVRQMLRALAYAHGQRLVHRDLKPANILVRRLPDGSSHLVVLDFGIAKFLDDEQAGVTSVGAILGTPAYMAPEQATGSAAKTMIDVYAAGLVAYELLTGRRPFIERDRAALLRAHMTAAPPIPTTLRPELGAISGVDGFLLKALEKKPANRYADAVVMLEAFERIATGIISSPSLPSPRVSFPSMPSQAVAAKSEPSLAFAQTVVEPVARMQGLGRTKLIVAAAIASALVLMMIGMGVYLLIEPDAPPPVAVPVPVVPVVPPVSAPPPSPLAQGVPEELAVLHRTIIAGAMPARSQLNPLYRYNLLHPTDARGQLLLGRTYTDRRWYSDATEAYAEACTRDRASAQDERLRADLVRIAAGPRFGPAAGEVIVSCLGISARAELIAAAQANSDAEARARLEALAAQLR